MDGPHRGLCRWNDFDLTVQGLSQSAQIKGSLNSEHGNQEHDDQDHKKNPHRNENTIAKPWVIGNRNRGATMRTGFQLAVMLLIALNAPNRFHIKRLTRLIYLGQMDFLQVYLTLTNTGEADSMQPGRRALCCGPDPDETETSRIGCLAVRLRQ